MRGLASVILFYSRVSHVNNMPSVCAQPLRLVVTSQIFREPPLADDDHLVLDLIQEQRAHLRMYMQNAPRRWHGSLRKLSLAKAVQGSNSIEGYDASLDEAVAAIEDEQPVDPKSEVWLALRGYQQALTYIMQAVRDPQFDLSEQLLKSLQFMMLHHDMKKNPGQYRPRSISVVNEKTGEVVYQAPPRELIEPSMMELLAYLRAPSATSVEIKAAMAHLNLTMIHPFSDGNGRMARALQTLILARDGGLVDPVFASIEEWLGGNTDAYYAILSETGKGHWNPGNDTKAWIRFCLKAHYQQAARVLRRNEEYASLYDRLELIRHELNLMPRMVLPLFDAALGLTIDNQRYQASAEVSPNLATRDLKVLVDLQLLEAHGEKRGRVYRRGGKLTELRRATRLPRIFDDPYDVVRRKDQDRRLPGI